MGFISIPKSTNPIRIKENANIFDFQICNEDMNKISLLNKNLRIGSNPDKVYQNPNILKG